MSENAIDFVTILLALGISACVTTSSVPLEIARAIPSDARAIRLYSDQPMATYYRAIYGSLAAQGFGVAQENQQMGTLSTQPKDIGQSTLLRLNVYVQDTVG